MTTTATPDTTTRPRGQWERPSLSSIAIHRIDPDQDVRVWVASGVPAASLGDAWATVVIHGYGPDPASGLANLAAIGRAITAQAEQALADRDGTEA